MPSFRNIPDEQLADFAEHMKEKIGRIVVALEAMEKEVMPKKFTKEMWSLAVDFAESKIDIAKAIRKLKRPPPPKATSQTVAFAFAEETPFAVALGVPIFADIAAYSFWKGVPKEKGREIIDSWVFAAKEAYCVGLSSSKYHIYVEKSLDKSLFYEMDSIPRIFQIFKPKDLSNYNNEDPIRWRM